MEQISALNGKRLKLVDQFIYLGRNILFTEKDINELTRKEWTVIKSDFSDKIKRSVTLLKWKVWGKKN